MHRSGHGLPLMLSHSPLRSLSPMLAIPHALLLSCALSPPCLTLAHLLSWSQSHVLGLMLLLSVLCAQSWSRSCTLALGLSHTLCLSLSLTPSVLVSVLRPLSWSWSHPLTLALAHAHALISSSLSALSSHPPLFSIPPWVTLPCPIPPHPSPYIPPFVFHM